MSFTGRRGHVAPFSVPTGELGGVRGDVGACSLPDWERPSAVASEEEDMTQAKVRKQGEGWMRFRQDTTGQAPLQVLGFTEAGARWHWQSRWMTFVHGPYAFGQRGCVAPFSVPTGELEGVGGNVGACSLPDWEWPPYGQ